MTTTTVDRRRRCRQGDQHDADLLADLLERRLAIHTAATRAAATADGDLLPAARRARIDAWHDQIRTGGPA